MNRRAFIAAVPYLALSASVATKFVGTTAVAAEAETPVAALFREWQRLRQVARAHYLAKEDDEFERADDARWAHEQILIHAPSQCERDLLLKILAWTDYGETDLEAERDNSHLSTIWAEARGMDAA